MDYVGIP